MSIFDILFLLFVFFSTLFGIVIGSFLNVVIYRIPAGRTVVKGHSMCMTCGHTLHAIDLIPIISWATLHGKCRYCGAPIASRYTKIESFTGAVFLIFALLNKNASYLPVKDYFDASTEQIIVLLFISYCVFLLAMAGLISAMMIYYDTGKCYYGYPVLALCAGLANFACQLFVYDKSFCIEMLVEGLITVAAAEFIIFLTAKIAKIQYKLSDCWFDLSFLLMFILYYAKIMPSISHLVYIISAACFYLLIRLICHLTKIDRYAGIISVVSIVIFSVLGYFI